MTNKVRESFHANFSHVRATHEIIVRWRGYKWIDVTEQCYPQGSFQYVELEFMDNCFLNYTSKVYYLEIVTLVKGIREFKIYYC